MAPLKTINRYHFLAEWGGNRVEFTEIIGLEIYIDVVNMRNGSSPENSELKIPGITKFADVVLKRNIVQGDQQFYDWIKTNSFGHVERRDVTIRLLDYQHQPLMTWRVRNAFPSRYIGPVLMSGDSHLATESLVLSHDGLDLLK